MNSKKVREVKKVVQYMFPRAKGAELKRIMRLAKRRYNGRNEQGTVQA